MEAIATKRLRIIITIRLMTRMMIIVKMMIMMIMILNKNKMMKNRIIIRGKTMIAVRQII